MSYLTKYNSWNASMQSTRLLCPWDFQGKITGVGVPFPPPGDLPNREIQLASPALSGRFFYCWAIWEAPKSGDSLERLHIKGWESLSGIVGYTFLTSSQKWASYVATRVHEIQTFETLCTSCVFNMVVLIFKSTWLSVAERPVSTFPGTYSGPPLISLWLCDWGPVNRKYT